MLTWLNLRLVKIRRIARILQGGRGGWLEVWSNRKVLNWIEVIFQWKLGDIHKKKGLCPNSKVFSGRNQKFNSFFLPKTGDLQKKGLRLKCFFVYIIVPAEFGAIFDWTLYVFFLSSTSAQIWMGGRLNLDGERSISMGLHPPSPYNLSTAYIWYEIQFLVLTAASLAARFNQINTGQLLSSNAFFL